MPFYAKLIGVIFVFSMTTTSARHPTKKNLTANYANCINDTEVLEFIKSDKTYSRYKLPEPMVLVFIEMAIQEVTAVNEATQDFTVDLYINEKWRDPALRFDHKNPCKQTLTLDYTIREKIWTPNTVFINSKSAEIHQSPFMNIFLMLYANGTVWTNYRLKLTGPCDMDLKTFPMDTQKCLLTFESYNYNNKEVQMIWNPSTPTPISLQGKTMLPDFFLRNTTPHHKSAEYAAGYWDELSAIFYFERRYGWYILQGYLPTSRTMLGVNALLAITLQFGNIIKNLPRVSYVKAIDVWMLSGMTFVFASLLELAVIGYLTKKQEAQEVDVQHSLRNQPLIKWTRTSSLFDEDRPKFMAVTTSHLDVDDFGVKDKRSELALDMSPRLRCSSVDRPVAGARWFAAATFNSRRQLTCFGICCDCWDTRSRSPSPDPKSDRHGNRSRSASVSKKKRHPKKEMCDPDVIDFYSAIMFPTAFGCFNAFYWGYYLGFADSVPLELRGT